MEQIDDIKNDCKCLYEVLVKKNAHVLSIIKSLKMSAISDNHRNNIPRIIVKDIYENLKDWDVNIPSFDNLTSEENCLETFQYLLEMAQNDNALDCGKVKQLRDRMKKCRDKGTISDYCQLVSDFIEELESAIEIYNTSPDSRNKTFKSLKDFATEIYFLLNELFIEIGKTNVSDLYSHAEELIVKLLKSSFVISEYPSKIIKKKTPNQTGTRFNATISCLMENEKLFSSNLHVNVYFLNEEEFKLIFDNPKIDSELKVPCTDIKKSNNSWNLQNMIWNPQKPKDNRKIDRITNIKSIIVFRIKISANPYAFKKTFQIDKDLFSDLVVSVVHSNQEVDASLTLFWDDYFRADKRMLSKSKSFNCHDSVPVKDLVHALSDYFLKQTSRGLTPSNMMFLEQKLNSRSTNGLINFFAFARNSMVGSSLSFGHWMYSILKLIKVDGTIGMWKKDLIDGFTPKEAEHYFTNYQKGTFFLRFAERNPKIGVVVKVGNKCNAWSPFSIEECRCRSLPERLMDYQELCLIRDANGKFFTKKSVLLDFIEDKTPDEGYTARGHLTKLCDGNLYMDDPDPFMDINDFSIPDDTMLFDEFNS